MAANVFPDSKVYGPHVGPINLAAWVGNARWYHLEFSWCILALAPEKFLKNCADKNYVELGMSQRRIIIACHIII